MKKHWFLVVMLALISFTACKKENMIVGKWELIETEGVDDFAEIRTTSTRAYQFDEYSYHIIVYSLDMESGKYSIKNNAITLEPSFSCEYRMLYPSTWKISFSGSKKMIWKDKKEKYTFKKI